MVPPFNARRVDLAQFSLDYPVPGPLTWINTVAGDWHRVRVDLNLFARSGVLICVKGNRRGRPIVQR